MTTDMATHAPETPARLDPRTTVGTVRLTVSDLARSRRFYEEVLGLRPVELETGGLGWTPAGANNIVVTTHSDGSASRLDRRATGLFHFALLFPSRRELAVALARVAQARWPLEGASDHLVSEALYLSDPDGNGIELYRDRPRNEWNYRDGQLEMATLPLDLEDLLGELRDVTTLPEIAPAGTRMGHVHLQVSELRETEAFYHSVLGFDVVVRGYPGALFVSAGGYHHHIGLNTWNSRGSEPPAPGAVGLRSYDIVVPDEAERERVLIRVRDAGIAVEDRPEGVFLRDPSGNGIIVRIA